MPVFQEPKIENVRDFDCGIAGKAAPCLASFPYGCQSKLATAPFPVQLPASNLGKAESGAALISQKWWELRVNRGI